MTYAALDYAASAPALQRVWDDVAAYAPYYGSVHRGAGYLSQLSTDLFEQSRVTVAEFLDCREGDQVVFTRSTTDSLNLLAQVVPADCQVFVFETEHHASLPAPGATPRSPTSTPRAPRPRRSRPWSGPLADRDPHGPALVCVTGASNVTGELWPVRELAAAAHAHGARNRPRRRPARPPPPGLRPRARRGLGRLLRPQAVRALRLRRPRRPAPTGSRPPSPTWPAAAPPAPWPAAPTAAWTSSGTPPRPATRPAPRTSSASTPSPPPARRWTEAGFDSLVARERHLIDTVRAGLAEVPEVRVLSLFGDDAPRVGVISFVVRRLETARTSPPPLSAEYGIGVRDGLFCAHPLVRTLLGSDPQDPGECGAPEPAAPGRALPQRHSASASAPAPRTSTSSGSSAP
ncbi:hypothetical protein Shyd_59940 [Streptomyces hydrogenans]|uniref:Aminotransferase class V domain-containing protein n=1 Tax=Streptomyces hydrogenans TaxID=1873719 RepID=A0ABQ3PHX3_9ACTN|nr:hypothetical protein Shyd_59940 [Streptomyces hydrogenans]